MWENIKVYLIQMCLKKYVPVAIASGMAALGTYLAAHAGVLEQYGVTYGVWPFHWAQGQYPSGPCILVELDTLSTATFTAVVALTAVVVRALQHHTTGTSAVTPPGEGV